MARQTQGRIFKRGKKGYFYIQYYLNGKQIVKALRDENDQPITGQREAQKAANLLLAPYKAENEVQRRQQAQSALKTAKEKAAEIEKKANAISIIGAIDQALKKPRKRKLSEISLRQKIMHWNDFASFMTDKYPDIKTLDQVIVKHAEEYTQHLIHKGRYNVEVKYTKNNQSGSYKTKTSQLSPRSVNAYMVSVNEVFKLLAIDAGIDQSPFANIPKQQLIQEKREAFTMDELKLILQNADEFIFSLFMVGLCTGLRKADICLLEWREVNLNSNMITRLTRKTQKEVTIPIMPPLQKFLKKQYSLTGDKKYVLPEHADMYLNNPSGIIWRVKTFLEGLGITTSKVPEGRERAVSIKDVHSLRHSFCYYAGLYNVPLAIVQAVVGHMSPEMTKHYTMHATNQDIKKAFLNMPDMFEVLDITSETKELPASEPERKQLRQLVDIIPLEDAKKVLEILKS